MSVPDGMFMQGPRPVQLDARMLQQEMATLHGSMRRSPLAQGAGVAGTGTTSKQSSLLKQEDGEDGAGGGGTPAASQPAAGCGTSQGGDVMLQAAQLLGGDVSALASNSAPSHLPPAQQVDDPETLSRPVKLTTGV